MVLNPVPLMPLFSLITNMTSDGRVSDKVLEPTSVVTLTLFAKPGLCLKIGSISVPCYFTVPLTPPKSPD
jgi:hypothetical protein